MSKYQTQNAFLVLIIYHYTLPLLYYPLPYLVQCQHTPGRVCLLRRCEEEDDGIVLLIIFKSTPHSREDLQAFIYILEECSYGLGAIHILIRIQPINGLMRGCCAMLLPLLARAAAPPPPTPVCCLGIKLRNN